MGKERLTHRLLIIAALFVGIAIPSLFFGRAVIGITLGLGLILTLIATPHKKNIQELRSLLPPAMLWVMGIAMIASAVNLPFSYRFDLSWEAWARTWILLLLVGYLLYALKDQIELILLTMCLSLAFVLIAMLIKQHFFHIVPSKAVLNGLLLCLPLCAYYCLKQHNRLWVLLALFNISFFIWFAATRPAKASIAGIIMMAVAAVTLYGLSKFKIRTALIMTGGVLVVITLGLVVWLPDSMNASSAENQGLTMIPVWALDLHRQLIWAFSLDRIMESPWLGYGLNASNYHPLAKQTIGEYFGGTFAHIPDISISPALPSHPHNWMIEMILDAGFIGFIPVLALVCLLFFKSIKRYIIQPNPALLGFITVNVGYWGTGLLNFSFWSVWWQVTYFVASATLFCVYLNEKHDA